MTPTAEKRLDDGSQYRDFIASLELYNIALTDVSCKINRSEYWHKEGEQTNKYKLVSKPSGIGDKSFDVRCSLMLNVNKDKSESSVVKISASYELHFHAKVGSKDFVERFCESDVLLIAMPYFRELVSDLTSKMYIPPIILPLTKGRK